MCSVQAQVPVRSTDVDWVLVTGVLKSSCTGTGLALDWTCTGLVFEVLRTEMLWTTFSKGSLMMRSERTNLSPVLSLRFYNVEMQRPDI